MTVQTSPDSLQTRNRALIAVAGVAIQMLLGTIYAWSVFKKPLMAAHGWTNTQVGLTFTLAIFCLGLAAAIGGRFVDRAGARKIAVLATVLFGLGTLMGGIAATTGNLWLLWIGYGVVGGLGNGLGYVTPVTVLVRWFPDRRGVITGVAVMGFGLGAAVTGQVAPLLMPIIGIGNTFYLMGALIMVVLALAATQMVNPPEGWAPPGWDGARAAAVTAPVSCDLSAALRMYQFYVLWGILFINVTAGIALISNLSPMAQSQVGLGAVAAGGVVLAASLCNGFGRILWSSLSDKIGRRTAFLLIIGTQIPLLLLLPSVTNPAVFVGICCYILLCYGGGFSTMPAFVADTFGARCMGDVYGKILLAWGVAGVVGPMLMEYAQKQTGSFATALQIGGGLLVLGLILALSYRTPRPAADRT